MTEYKPTSFESGYNMTLAKTTSTTTMMMARAEQYAPIIRELQRDGYSMRGIAVELERTGGV